MASVVINDENLINIATSIRNKNGSSDTYKPSEMATAIDNIPSGGGGGGEWQPHPDWWDIETILKEDTEDYPQKIILLIRDLEDSSPLGRAMDNSGNAKMIKTSDGVVYENQSNISHTWDKTKDKPCSLGYKTRYVIYYYTDYVYNFSDNNLAPTVIYVVCDAIWQSSSSSGKHIFNSPTNNAYILEGIKCLENNIFTGISGTGNLLIVAPSVPTLKSIEGIKASSNITNLATTPTNTSGLQKLTYDVDCTNMTNMPALTYASDLRHLSGLRNINANFTLTNAMSLTKESLLEIINNLIDLTGQTAKSLVIGKYNIPKLTAEELAIATNKNWTVS